MPTVQEHMTTDPAICESTDTLADAARRMRDEDIGDVLVKIDGSFGIVTDRDIVVRGIARGVAPDQATLGDIASRDLEAVSASDDLDEVVATMRERDIRRVPVCEDGQPVGILSLGDLAVTKDPDSVLSDISEAPPNN